VKRMSQPKSSFPVAEHVVPYMAAYNSVVAMPLRIVLRHVYSTVPMYMDTAIDEREAQHVQLCSLAHRNIRTEWAWARRGYGWYTWGWWENQFVFSRNVLQIAIFGLNMVLPPYPLLKTYDTWPDVRGRVDSI
jgi:hypothetical protein